jgi:hypothetical protein
MDSSQSPSPNDQRRISTTNLLIGVDSAGLSGPSPDAAPQPAPINPTTLVPSEKTFELMRQLEVLAQEVAVVSRGDSFDQAIKVQKGSNFPAGLQLVEPSIRVSPHQGVAIVPARLCRRRAARCVNDVADVEQAYAGNAIKRCGQ